MPIRNRDCQAGWTPVPRIFKMLTGLIHDGARLTSPALRFNFNPVKFCGSIIKRVNCGASCPGHVRQLADSPVPAGLGGDEQLADAHAADMNQYREAKD